MSDHAFGLSTTAVAFIKAIMTATHNAPVGTVVKVDGSALDPEDLRRAHIDLREGSDNLGLFTDFDSGLMTVTVRG